MADRRTRAEMIGELLRDASVLVAVFAPLEIYVPKQPLTWGASLIILVLVLGLAGAGIAIEERR